MILKPLRSTTRTACAIPKPLPSRMLSVLMESLDGRGGRGRGGSDDVCRRLAPWRIYWEKAIGILVGAGEKGRKGRKIPVLATVESTAVLFWSNPLFEQWERPNASCRVWLYGPLDGGATAAVPPGLSTSAF